jgi:hypothetical protein
MESVNAPEMGPFYMMAIEVGAGALNPNSTSSFDKYLYNSLDGKVTFYFKLSNTRDDILTDSSIAATYNINYAGSNVADGRFANLWECCIVNPYIYYALSNVKSSGNITVNCNFVVLYRKVI